MSPIETGEGVTTLQDAVARAAAKGTAVSCSDSDFIILEDGKAVDCTESDFRATQLLGKNVEIPTVLVLDLSGSIVASGALERIKTASLSIIDAMLPEQSMAIITFADAPNLRVPLTSNKEELKQVVEAISASDGVSTNLNDLVCQNFGTNGTTCCSKDAPYHCASLRQCFTSQTYCPAPADAGIGDAGLRDAAL